MFLRLIALCTLVVPATAHANVTITTPAALAQALSSAKGGEVFRLAPGDYGTLTLAATAFSAPVTLTSSDPAHPARLDGLATDGTANLTLDHIAFTYTYHLGDPKWAAPFAVTGGQNLTFSNNTFTGANASGTATTADGLGNGNGLMARGVSGLTLTGNRFSDFFTGLTVRESNHVTIRANDFSAMRSDGMDLISVQHALIEGNHSHDFIGQPNWNDHRDMLQLWTNGEKAPTTDVTIRGNRFDIGHGSFTQSIFIRNEEVDQGRAGPEMYYRNIVIEDNTLTNNHHHGITVGETDGLVIRHNTVLEVPDTSATAASRTGSPATYVPTINVNPKDHNVVIEGNVTAAINGYSKQPDWAVCDNVLVEKGSNTAENGYPRSFITSTLVNGGTILARPGGKIDRLHAGAPALHYHPTANTALFSIDTASATARRFDASFSTGPDAKPLPPAAINWRFSDGSIATGPIVTHDFKVPGTYSVTLTLASPTLVSVSAPVTIAATDMLRFAPTTGALLVRSGAAMEPLPGVKPVTVPGTQTLALATGQGGALIIVDKSRLPDIFGASALHIALKLRAAETTAPAGEILRLNNALVLTIRPTGVLQLWMKAAKSPINLHTGPLPLLDHNWHDIVLSYDDGAGTVTLATDGILRASAATAGPTDARRISGLSLGNPRGKTFDGFFAGLSLR
ncbi:MAG: right-handed parallel beta-helix repeat-containing protein [Paracoccaceae bacterium]|nr:right-handed parallel beta-helix repeat-containing protein [Paracoccaceae bacterium]